MKTLTTIILLITTLTTFSQTRLSITQDARLAFYGDDKGNESYTPNLTFRISQFFVEGRYLNPIVAIDYEIADLQGGLYSRMGIGIGININKLLPYTEFQYHLSSGIITRNGRSYASPEMVGNISFKITKKISFLLEGQRSVRNDIKGQPVIYSGKIGLRFEIFYKPTFSK